MKTAGVPVRFVFLATFLPLTLPASAHTSGKKTAAAHPEEYAIGFKDQLGLERDIRLTADVTYGAITFRCESSRKPAAGSRLHLFLEHSPGLDGSRSFLSITMNFGILRSLRLHGQNEELTEVIIPLPPKMLRLENELEFSVEQYPAGATAPSEVWTAISARSYIVIRSEANAPAQDLSLLPAPLLDPCSYRPKKLAVLLPQQLSLETLEATALLVANLCARVSPDPVDIEVVRRIDAAQAPLLVVGTPREQPDLRGFLEKRFLSIHGGVGEPRIHLTGGEGLAESEGAVVLVARPQSHPVLCLTGISPKGVLRAARSLASPEFSLPATSVARISSGHEVPPAQPRQWRGFMPPKDRFSLKDLGYQDLKIERPNVFSLDLPIRALPDAQFLAFGHEMELSFKLSPELDTENCRLGILWNDVSLGTYPLRERAKGSTTSLRIRIPPQLLAPVNHLKAVIEGSSRTAWRKPAAWLLSSSEFYLPRVYVASLPDLGLLRSHLYPFSIRADLSDTIVLLPNQRSTDLFPVLLKLAVALGRMSPSRHLGFRLRRIQDLTWDEKASSHFISLHVDSREDSPERVFWKTLPRTRAMRGASLIQEAPSPWNAHRFVLAISAASLQSLHRAVQELFLDLTLQQLKGDAASLGREIKCFELAAKRTLREGSFLTPVEAWLRVNWLALPLILTVVSGLLFIALRLTLNRYSEAKKAELITQNADTDSHEYDG